MSSFNGREPDANRADLDLAALDSVSGRLTLCQPMASPCKFQRPTCTKQRRSSLLSPQRREPGHRVCHVSSQNRGRWNLGDDARRTASIRDPRSFRRDVSRPLTAAALLESSVTFGATHVVRAGRRSSESPPTIFTRTSTRRASSRSESCKADTSAISDPGREWCRESAGRRQSASFRRSSHHATTDVWRRDSGCSSASGHRATSCRRRISRQQLQRRQGQTKTRTGDTEVRRGSGV